ncbi:hypothetical protein NKI19_05730 [Mesorhizobium sp. M0751]|uniref:hypothetical protein n=1 Tax=unclassified Mesorhizobium TaxID=325217 RepID=UPI0033380527
MIDIEEVDDPVSTAGDRADPERPGVVDLRGREGTGAEPNRLGGRSPAVYAYTLKLI